MEFLRFGSSIPGSYWGCCAVCIIQNFNHSPDAKASIELVDGDGGYSITDEGTGQKLFAGPTYKDIFLQRLRYGTFGIDDMPNHVFLAVLTESQLKSEVGQAWLKLLKEQGFEFIRSFDNSVYSGSQTISDPEEYGERSSHPNYLFGLFRNIGAGAMKNPFEPPKEWTDLPTVVPEAWDTMFAGTPNPEGELTDFNTRVRAAQLPLYEALPQGEFHYEEDLEKAGVPVTYAGQRSRYPQQSKFERGLAIENNKNLTKTEELPAAFA